MDLNPPEFIVAELVEDAPPPRRRSNSRSRSRSHRPLYQQHEFDEPAFEIPNEEPPSLKSAALVVAIIVGCIIFVLMTGCATTTVAHGEIINGVDYPVGNVHRLAPKFPERLRRVAILPLSAEPGSLDSASGREDLEPILQSELDRLSVFEVVRITPAQMRSFTQRSDWSATDKLPQNFLTTIKQETGCDAVMFCRLTRYHAYPPLAIGWNLKLADATDGQIWWAVDEMFDLADRRVVNSARRYELDHQKYYQATPELADSRTVLISPRRLARYSASAMFATLPQR